MQIKKTLLVFVATVVTCIGTLLFDTALIYYNVPFTIAGSIASVFWLLDKIVVAIFYWIPRVVDTFDALKDMLRELVTFLMQYIPKEALLKSYANFDQIITNANHLVLSSWNEGFFNGIRDIKSDRMTVYTMFLLVLTIGCWFYCSQQDKSETDAKTKAAEHPIDNISQKK